MKLQRHEDAKVYEVYEVTSNLMTRKVVQSSWYTRQLKRVFIVEKVFNLLFLNTISIIYVSTIVERKPSKIEGYNPSLRFIFKLMSIQPSCSLWCNNLP